MANTTTTKKIQSTKGTMTPIKKGTAKSAKAPAKPQGPQKIMLRPDQVVITKSHLSKIKNAAARSASFTAPVADPIITPAPVQNFKKALSTPLPGTNPSNKYTPVFANSNGVIGVRVIESGKVRVRVVPSVQKPIAGFGGWNLPSSNNYRYSTVVSFSEMISTLNTAALNLSA